MAVCTGMMMKDIMNVLHNVLYTIKYKRAMAIINKPYSNIVMKEEIDNLSLSTLIVERYIFNKDNPILIKDYEAAKFDLVDREQNYVSVDADKIEGLLVCRHTGIMFEYTTIDLDTLESIINVLERHVNNMTTYMNYDSETLKMLRIAISNIKKYMPRAYKVFVSR